MSLILIVLIVLLLLSVASGGFGWPISGAYAWSPLGLLVVVILLLWLVGALR